MWVQNLTSRFDGHEPGSKAEVRAYYDVRNSETGEVGRLYTIHITSWSDAGTPVHSEGTYYAFSNGFDLRNGATVERIGGPHPVASVPHSDLYICFAEGTMIAAPGGERRIESLAPGDRVMTADRGAQPLRWIGSRCISAAELARSPALRPIRIRAGALGAGRPAQDLLLSPQHRVLVRSRIAERMFGSGEVLVAARQLLSLPGVELAEDVESVTYFHLLLDRHEVLFANGAEAESLYFGPQARSFLGPEALDEVLAILPELADEDLLPVPCRLLVPGRAGRRMVQRHVGNRRQMVEAPAEAETSAVAELSAPG